MSDFLGRCTFWLVLFLPIRGPRSATSQTRLLVSLGDQTQAMTEGVCGNLEDSVASDSPPLFLFLSLAIPLPCYSSPLGGGGTDEGGDGGGASMSSVTVLPVWLALGDAPPPFAP